MKKEIGIILGVLVLFGTVILVEPAFAQEEFNRNGFGKFAGEHPLNDLTAEQRETLKTYMEEHRTEIDEMMETRQEMRESGTTCEEMRSVIEENRLKLQEDLRELGIDVEIPFGMRRGFRNGGFGKGFN